MAVVSFLCSCLNMALYKDVDKVSHVEKSNVPPRTCASASKPSIEAIVKGATSNRSHLVQIRAETLTSFKSEVVQVLPS